MTILINMKNILLLILILSSAFAYTQTCDGFGKALGYEESGYDNQATQMVNLAYYLDLFDGDDNWFACVEAKEHIESWRLLNRLYHGDSTTFGLNNYLRFAVNRNNASQEIKDSTNKFFDKRGNGEAFERKLWRYIESSAFITPKGGYKDWNNLDADEKDLLWKEAEKGKESEYDDSTRFEILLSVVWDGEYKAARSLALAYFSGIGTIENHSIARSLFKLSYTEHGDIESAFSYAIMCEFGLGRSPYYKEAAKYFEIAVDVDVRSKRYLGEYYLFGLGGKEKNISKAKEYFKLAADAGDAHSVKCLQVIEDLESKNPIILENKDVKLTVLFTEGDWNPAIIDCGKGWAYNVDYVVSKRKNRLQMFPTVKNLEGEKLNDAINYSNYSPCNQLSGIGQQKISVGNKKETREIGYLYYDVSINGQKIDQLKIPMIVFWKSWRRILNDPIAK
jgi:tetratricopeptide (TPR) repeat protein